MIAASLQGLGRAHSAPPHHHHRFHNVDCTRSLCSLTGSLCLFHVKRLNWNASVHGFRWLSAWCSALIWTLWLCNPSLLTIIITVVVIIIIIIITNWNIWTCKYHMGNFKCTIRFKSHNSSMTLAGWFHPIWCTQNSQLNEIKDLAPDHTVCMWRQGPHPDPPGPSIKAALTLHRPQITDITLCYCVITPEYNIRYCICYVMFQGSLQDFYPLSWSSKPFSDSGQPPFPILPFWASILERQPTMGSALLDSRPSLGSALN